MFGRLAAEGPGGKAANVAATLAALNINTFLICRLGDDRAGREVRSAAASTPALRLCPQLGSATQLADVLVTPNGQRTIVTVTDGTTEPDPDDGALSVVKQAQVCWIHIADPLRRAAFHRAVKGRWAGIPLEYLGEEIEAGRTWPLVIGSAHDTKRPESPALEAAGVRVCVITEGASGGQIWTPGHDWRRYQAHPVRRAVDTCGAGDAFVGGFLAGIIAHRSPDQAASTGAYAAAQVVTHFGAWPLSR